MAMLDKYCADLFSTQHLAVLIKYEPTFPTSFEFQKYYYYIEFEEAGIIFKLCRSGDGFVLKRESTVLIFDNVSELKRYWNRNIFPLPSIAKNQLLRIVDPVLYVQLFFIGQDKKDTSNIANHGFYNKQDFIDTTSLTITPSLWIRKTHAVGIQVKQGKGGGVSAYPEIAAGFQLWIDPKVRLAIVRKHM